jgi:hypothetical protein
MLARMTEGRARRFCAGIVVVCGVAVTAACGNYHPNGIEFRFTPIPVITSDVLLGTPVSITPTTCSVFAADRVGVLLHASERKSFEQWLDDIGFVVLRTTSSSFKPQVLYLVQVPPGSVPDAIALLVKQRGVQSADEEFLDVRLIVNPQPPSLGVQLGCKPPVSQGGQP